MVNFISFLNDKIIKHAPNFKIQREVFTNNKRYVRSMGGGKRMSPAELIYGLIELYRRTGNDN